MNENTSIPAYQLLARLKHTVLTQGNWDEEMFIGTFKQWNEVRKQETFYENEVGNVIKW